MNVSSLLVAPPGDGRLPFDVRRIDRGDFLLGAGLSEVVIGLAARPTAESIIAGVVLLFSGPSVVGTPVVVGEYEGLDPTAGRDGPNVDGSRSNTDGDGGDCP